LPPLFHGEGDPPPGDEGYGGSFVEEACGGLHLARFEAQVRGDLQNVFFSGHALPARSPHKSMLGEDAPGVNPEVISAIGEITNIISGQTRFGFEKLGFKLSAAVPTVIVGQNAEVKLPAHRAGLAERSRSTSLRRSPLLPSPLRSPRGRQKESSS